MQEVEANSTGPQRSGIAAASLVCGLLFCFPLTSLLAIIFGIIGLNKTRDRRVRGRGMSIAGILLGIGGLWFSISLILSVRGDLTRVLCERNMKHIGEALSNYATEYHGQYPPDLGTLIKTRYMLSAWEFACPATHTVVPDDMSAGQAADWVNSHSDYIYNAAGLAGHVNAAYILRYEKDDNHTDGMMSLLFADGHVKVMKLSDAHAAIDRSKKQLPKRPN